MILEMFGIPVLMFDSVSEREINNDVILKTHKICIEYYRNTLTEIVQWF